MTSHLDTITGLLHWFYFEADKFRSYQAIEKTCKRTLFANVDKEEAKYAIYDIFYPLIRWGVVEYYGNNHFRQSPTSGLFHGNKVLVCNSHFEMNEHLMSFQLLSLPGISLYNYCPEVITSFKTHNISLIRFDLYQYLNTVPTIGKLVQKWDQEQIIDTSSYQYFNDKSSWINLSGQKESIGVYRKSERYFSAKVIKLSEKEWKSIPERKQQFDAFSLAVLLSRIQNGRNLGIHYSKQSQILTVHTHFFPVILERILFINTMLSDSFHKDALARTYHLDIKGFLLLNKIFHNAIQIK
jgi:hypothetical protein